MPYRIIKKGSKYQVKNRLNGKIHAYHTTKKKAERQLRLLNYLDHKK